MSATPVSRQRRAGAALWAVQVMLAALFLFAGVMKFVLPPAQLTAQLPVSVGFIQFIGVMEILGAIGLVLPGLTGIRPRLTPLAAQGLMIIMAGAVGVTLPGAGAAAALVPGVVGVLAGLVAVGRRDWAPRAHAVVVRLRAA